MAITADPPELMSQVAPSVRTTRAIRTDLYCSFSRWEIDLILYAHFQRHVLAKSPRNNSAYCCGIKSGEIEIYFPSCELRYCDGGEYIDTEVERQQSEGSGRSKSFSPEASLETPVGKAAVNFGSIDSTSERSAGKKSKYTIQEALVAVMQHNHGASWIVSMPEGSGISVDYLHRTFSFNLSLKGQKKDFRGRIKVRPGAFDVYDSNGQFVSEKFSLKALFLAMMEGRSLSRLFCDEYDIDFEHEKQE